MIYLSRRALLLGALALTLVAPALARDPVPFDQAAFEAAQAAANRSWST